MTPYQDNPRPHAPPMIAVRAIEALRSTCTEEPLLVLDAGCSKGYMAARLKSLGSYRVDGIEKDPDDAEAARQYCDRLFHANLDDPEAILETLPAESYDVMLFLDVLEHLRDPLSTLKALCTRLAPGGLVIVSLPNIAHASIRLSLLCGRFQYRQTGILDRTHLYFYTRRSARDLVTAAGLHVRRMAYGSNRFGRFLRYFPICGGWLGFNLVLFATAPER